MGHIPLPHEYDDEDTQPYEWTPPLQTPTATWSDRVHAEREQRFRENLRQVMAQHERERGFLNTGIVPLMEEEPVEPDAAIAAERVPSPVRRVALAVGRWLVAIGEAS